MAEKKNVRIRLFKDNRGIMILFAAASALTVSIPNEG